MTFVEGIASLTHSMGLSYEGLSLIVFLGLILYFFTLVVFFIFGVFLRNKAKDALQQAKEQWRNDIVGALSQASDKLIGQLSESVRQSEMAVTQVMGQNESLSRQTMVDTIGALQRQVTGQITETERGFRAFASEQLSRTDQLTDRLTQKLDSVGNKVEVNLENIRVGNEAKLEKIRETVEEKLQTTLQQRVSESFRLVSARLDEVYSGLGEMKRLASDVGSLKQVLVNVKSRGMMGEVQLGALLSEYFTADQYAKDVHPVPNQPNLVVEFAVRMPGKDGVTCWLPIDSKFPIEDYQRLQNFQEAGDRKGISVAKDALQKRILSEGKAASKYIHSPETTDFAIIFLPSEGLYAEVLSIPGLAERLFSESRVYVMGPSTLASALCAYRAGFQSMAIEKRSSEVRKMLAGVKTEFLKFGEVLKKLKDQLEAASKTVDSVETRTRQMNRKLSGLEQTEIPVVDEFLQNSLPRLNP